VLLLVLVLLPCRSTVLVTKTLTDHFDRLFDSSLWFFYRRQLNEVERLEVLPSQAQTIQRLHSCSQKQQMALHQALRSVHSVSAAKRQMAAHASSGENKDVILYTGRLQCALQTQLRLLRERADHFDQLCASCPPPKRRMG